MDYDSSTQVPKVYRGAAESDDLNQEEDDIMILAHDEGVSVNSDVREEQQGLRNRFDRVQGTVERGSLNVLSAKFESLDYDICENNLLLDEDRSKGYKFVVKKNLARWLVFFMIGIITALIASLIDITIEELSGLKYGGLKYYVDKCVTHQCLIIPYVLWISANVIPVVFGSILVAYVEPCAAGSGIPQVKCYLNGVMVPRVVRIKTLLVKTVGVVCSVVGGLAVGKEGPMIHAGAVVAAGISQGKSTTFAKDLKLFKYFREDHEKRDFVSGGAAAGVAAAFGAPVGGVLFSLEEGASFWNQSLTWRIFFASMVSSFTLSVVLSSYHLHPGQLTYSGLLNFGQFESLSYEFFEFPIFLLMGGIGGLLGSLFNHINYKLTVFRMRCINKRWLKVIEAAIVAMITATIGFGMIYFLDDCRPLGKDPTKYPIQMHCHDGEYNAVAAIWFQTPEASVRSLFHDPPGAFRLKIDEFFLRKDGRGKGLKGQNWNLESPTWLKHMPRSRKFQIRVLSDFYHVHFSLGFFLGSHKAVSVALFFALYFLLSCWTYGLSVSSGLFIPTLLTGAAWGRLIGMGLESLWPNMGWANPGKYALVGAAAQLGGVVRMTISLTVILIEATGSISFGLPLMIILITAKWFGDYFNEGVYDIHIQLSGVPILPWQPPPLSNNIYASEIMSHPVVTFKTVESVGYIVDVLRKETYNGFPVVEPSSISESDSKSFGMFRGLILRSQLIVLLQNKVFNESPEVWKSKNFNMKLFQDAYPRYPIIQQIHVSQQERNFTIDLRPFMNRSPYTVQHSASLPRVFRLFRALGLRHLVVVNGTNEVVGMVTRKDLALFRVWKHRGKMGVEKLLISEQI